MFESMSDGITGLVSPRMRRFLACEASALEPVARVGVASLWLEGDNTTSDMVADE